MLDRIFRIIKGGTSAFTLCNLVGGIILLLIAIYILLKRREKSKVAGFVCLGLSILMLLGSASNFLFSHFFINLV